MKITQEGVHTYIVLFPSKHWLLRLFSLYSGDEVADIVAANAWKSYQKGKKGLSLIDEDLTKNESP